MEFSLMANQQPSNIITNLNKLIDASGLSDISFSNILGISLRKLRYIKSGKSNLKFSDVETFAEFFGSSVSHLSKSDFNVNPNLREKLLEKYKKSDEHRIHFEKTPSIVYIVRYYLIGLKEFSSPMEIREIKGLLEKNKGWFYTSSALSHALKRETQKINIQHHRNKKRRFVYSRK